MKLPIYLDYMATTPVDSRVIAKMRDFLGVDGAFGNPSSDHAYGWQAKEAVVEATQHAANLINAKPEEIVWTSGATEAINLALKGAARFYSRKGKHIVTCKTEHKAVLDSCDYLENQGFEVTYLTPEKNGIIDVKKLQAALRDDTILVSIMHVNNEIGVIQDIVEISKLTRERGIIFHVDAAQSVGKLPLDMQKNNIDLLSMSGHKIYAPKGVGFLYVRHEPRVRLEPLIHGGGHQQQLRSGTLSTQQIVALGEALLIAKAEMHADHTHILALRNKLWDGIKNLPGITLNGDFEKRIAGNLNVSFADINGDDLLLGLNDLAVSAASACSATTKKPSYVVCSLGGEPKQSTLRLSVGRFTTEEEIDYAVKHISETVNRLLRQ